MNSLFGRIVGIVACAAAGAWCGWSIAAALAPGGTSAALLAAVLAMAVAAACYVGWSTLGRKLGRPP
jgi:hypothetical protein